jgi:TRAP-type C4-dicarboxylate transport system substrate-binding protein
VPHALLTTVLLCGGAAAAHAQTKWDLSGMNSINHVISQRYLQFVDEVKKRTNGQLVITYRPAGELPIRGTEVLKAVGENEIESGDAFAGFISGSIPMGSITSMPLLVTSQKEYEEVMPIISKYLTPEFNKFGVTPLYAYSLPVMDLYGRGNPIRKLSDFAGRKFRVTDSSAAEFVKAVGASSMTLDNAEVPTAIDRGVVDGFATTSYNILQANWAEFTKWSWTPHFYVGGPIYLLVNTKAYDALPADVRKVLTEVGQEFGSKLTAENFANEASAEKTLHDKYGVEFVVPSDDEMKEVTSRMKVYWSAWGDRNGPNAKALMEEVRAKLGK